MLLSLSFILSYFLDAVFGDPECLNFMHPVCIMGKAEKKLEKKLNKTFLNGAGLTVFITAGSYLFFFIILFISGRISFAFYFIMSSILGCFSIARKSLIKESKNIYDILNSDFDEKIKLKKARKALSRIVGRDTKDLSFDKIIKGTIESVAESFNDGIVAPLFYLFLGGVPLAMLYKAANTLDSMIGYKNKTYYYFGKAAARLDDILNFIPSRLSAIFLLIASKINGLDTKNAFKIFIRDRYKSSSINSGQTEAVAAGALNLRLLGPASYFGKKVYKKYIGDEKRKAEKDDILKINDLINKGGLVALITFFTFKTMFIIIKKRGKK